MHVYVLIHTEYNNNNLQNKGTHRRKVDEKSCVTPAGTSNELDVQNGWEENTHTQIK